ncbi:protein DETOXIFICATION 12-like [Benincasa hispida]|uniref:protein DETOXIFICATION 12-like n=1 Tax=Benincasa hispida TaxID=102211 RepID=UPI001902ADFA|nr:protein DETOXIFICATION 12-like [Benincasa hispida]
MENGKDCAMEETLLAKQKENNLSSTSRGVFLEEMKRVGYLAAPLVIVTFSQFMLQIITLMMVGHLGALALSSTAIAFSISAVTGFSVLLGLSSALETLCGQAYGAQQYQKVGVQTYTGMFCIFLICIPLSLSWLFLEKLLLFAGQDPLISHEAGKFIVWLIPGLFGSAFLQPLVRYFQSQSLVIPMVIFSCITLCFHIPFCWLMVYKAGLRNLGGALSMSLSYWLNVILLALYMKFSPRCEKTRGVISMELFQGIREFFSLAIPSAVMVCLEWWSFELIILLSGLLPNPELETSVLSVCLNTIATLYSIAYGLGAAGSTRVSNELGAGNPQAARRATSVVVFLAILETSILSTILFALRHVFGYTFSNEKDVVAYVASMAPLICVSVILDGIQGVLSGIARGCGWQHIGAYVNLGAFYLCGVPVAALLGFLVHLRGRGLWIGIQIGAFVQAMLLSFITIRINWEEQARRAGERLLISESSYP